MRKSGRRREKEDILEGGRGRWKSEGKRAERASARIGGPRQLRSMWSSLQLQAVGGLGGYTKLRR
jgi:hypothetical protein